MIKPRRLKRGDRIALVSLSWGGLGDPPYRHRFDIAKDRLARDFGLELVPMPHALAGSDFVARHPQLRARDLMEAFENPDYAGIFSAIGGDDAIRTLPYIDLDIIRQNPKVFMGYSDTTIHHFMAYKAGLVSFYGPSVMAELGDYVKMLDYTSQALDKLLFHDSQGYQLEPSPLWTDQLIDWDEKNQHLSYQLKEDPKGYEILQGQGQTSGHLLSGCLDVFMMAIGTKIWPSLEDWKGAILFMETSEDKPYPDFVRWTLRNLAAQGILAVIKGILVGKPQAEVYYQAYKEAILDVVSGEEKLTVLPVFYKVNFGHAKPIAILPYGIKTQLDCDRKSITFLESATL
ncbi:MAG: LD-carboxypeptidase [Clostridiaceae bacterium]|nr:LD-carboxypeptidase [Clostridiaceae bacterium]